MMVSRVQPCDIALEDFRLYFRQRDLLCLPLDPALRAGGFEELGRCADHILVDRERLLLGSHQDYYNVVVVVVAATYC